MGLSARFVLRLPVTLLCVLPLMSCGGLDPETSFVSLDPLAVSHAPLSGRDDIALTSETTACVIESFEHRVHCIERDGGLATVFGRDGDGPGEFRAPAHVVRGPGRTVGVIDYELARMAVFEPSGTWLFDVRLPGTFIPAAPFQTTLTGYRNRIDTSSRAWQQIEISVPSGEILWERVVPNKMAAAAGCEPGEGLPVPGGRITRNSEGIGPTALFPDSSMVFPRLCHGQMLFVEHRDADRGTVVQAPTWAGELPSEQDVERHLERCRSSPLRALMPVPCYEEEFRRTPKRYNDSYQSWVDYQGRLWVLTNRDRNEFTYLDVYNGRAYLGTVRVRHRGASFDVFGSTLAVLVDRPVGLDDPDGFPDRGIDWYDISGLNFGASSNLGP